MPPKVLFIDALGTIVELEPPWDHLSRALGVEADRAFVAAVKTEMAFYRDHSHEGHDEASLAALRRRCAEILAWELDREVPVETMLEAFRFRPFPDARPALEAITKRGVRLICVSNWDISLPDVLERCGLTDLFDGVVTSAGAGSRKPEPGIFAAALDLAGCGPGEAVHVGDTVDEDVEGARGAGIRALLISRDGDVGDGDGRIASLAELPGAVEALA